MAKVYVATMHTGNTLTIHGHTFFRGRPTVVTEPVLIEYLKSHPNFRLDEKIVADSVTPEEAKTSAVRRVKDDLKESGEYVAPAVFEGSDQEVPTATEEIPPATPPKSPTARRGAISAPRPTAGK